jgi:hypothetical protein
MPANIVITNVLADLDTATQMLANDPIINEGPQTTLSNAGDNFYRYRNLHMNYYAVKALQARANLYAGNKDKALMYAEQVINEAGKWFPWTNGGAVITPTYLDKIFSPEVLFGVQNLNLYTQYNALFSYNLAKGVLLAPQPTRLSNLFIGSDYRYAVWFKVPQTGGDRTFFKFEDVFSADSGDFRRYYQPLIRFSEMYYIAAETQTDPAKALTYMNTVRRNRGLTDLAPTANLQNEIQQEYAREFYGEGQLFFYYKRKALTSIPNGSSGSGNLTMGAAQYVVPIPQSESGVIN